MKVGLSFSRCLRDLVEGRVDYEDILVIIARTDFNPHIDDEWEQIWEGYRYGGWSNAEWSTAEDDTGVVNVEEIYRNVAIQLYDNGKLHQPRKFGSHPPRMNYHWLDCSVPSNERSPAAQKAWEQYQIISGLSRKQRVLKDDF